MPEADRVTDTTTDEKIRPIIFETYGKNAMAAALVDHLVERIDGWPNTLELHYGGARTREDMVRLRCWDWFGGGGTAANVAHKIEEALHA